MAGSQTDLRQTVYRPTATILTASAGSAGDTIITALNSEATPPLAMLASSTPNLVLQIGNITVVNPSTSRNRSIPPISNLLPTFASGTVTLSSSGSGTATPSVGSAISLGMTASQFMKIGVNISSSGSLTLLAGTPASTLAGATVPASVSNTFAIGYFVVRTDASNNVQNILNSDIYQYVGGGGGSGTGNASTILETLKNQLVDSPFQLMTPNVIATSGSALFSAFSGASYDTSTNTIKFTANAQTATSTNLLDTTEFFPQALDVGSIDLSVFWDKGQTSQAFSVPTSFTYNVSRDGGNNYFPVTMNRVGTTEVFYGTLQFGTSTTTESTNASLATISGGTQTTTDLNTTTQQQIAQSFTVPSGANWVVNQATLNFTKTGSPTGNVFVSLLSSSAGLPTSTILAQSLAVTASSITTGAVTINLPSTVLTGGTGTVYQLVVSTDATYKGTYSAGVTSLALTQTTATTGESVYNGTTWSAVSGKALVSVVLGRTQDLRVQIVSAGSPTYPCGLDGFGIFYNLQNLGIVGATKKTQKFIFNSVTDNLSTFTITNFSPDPDLLSCYWVEGGQVFKAPAFQLQGNVVSFPTGSFNQAGVSQTITLVFDQNSGGAFDNSDSNAQLLAANHLGSSSASIDRSLAGRGILLRDASGTLREVSLDSNDNLQVIASGTQAVVKFITPKTYRFGTAYTNGTPSLSSVSGFSGTLALSSDGKSSLTPYQVADGTWRIRFNFQFSSNSVSSGNISLSGLAFAGTGGGLNQSVSVIGSSGPAIGAGYTLAAGSQLFLMATTAQSSWSVSGDVELGSKPTWAD